MKRFKARQTYLLFLLILSVFVITGCGDGGGHHHDGNGGGGGGDGDSTRPTVVSTVAANLATLVPVNRNITATFSEKMDPATITTATFTVTDPTATLVPGVVTYVGLVATFNPTGDLAPDTLYTARITTGAEDLAGNRLASNYVWSFTTGTAADATAPIVSSTIPANGATGVAVNANIAATFSEPMDPLTLTTTTMTLKQTIGLVPVSGTVTYVGTTATFNPDSNLLPSTNYTATITTGAKDLADNALASNYVWTFDTGTTGDTTAPTVISTIPAAGDVGVAVNANITATFDEPMDPSTITTTTFTLKQGITPVPGAVTSPSTTTATFNPDSNLLPLTTYTATITTGVKDLAGNAMAVTKTWSFITSAGTALGPLPVDLGTAGNFVILAKSGISTIPNSVITGDIGVSPIDSTAITGFSLALDLSGVFSTSTQVTGKVYAANYAVPTPANLTAAVSDMETAYTDAAGRTLPDFTELGAGDISGMTLVPGLYKWSGNVVINTDVTLDGGANDVWIFQIAGDLTLANGKKVLLAGGAQPKNIFWQTFGVAAIGTTGAEFNGVILCQTKITVGTLSTVNGRLLAQTAVTLDQDTVTQPAP